MRSEGRVRAFKSTSEAILCTLNFSTGGDARMCKCVCMSRGSKFCLHSHTHTYKHKYIRTHIHPMYLPVTVCLSFSVFEY